MKHLVSIIITVTVQLGSPGCSSGQDKKRDREKVGQEEGMDREKLLAEIRREGRFRIAEDRPGKPVVEVKIPQKTDANWLASCIKLLPTIEHLSLHKSQAQ